MAVVPFVDEVPRYTIVRGRMHISTSDWACCFDLETFELGMARAAAAIAKHRLAQIKGGEVVAFPKPVR